MMPTVEKELRRRLLDVSPEPNESLPFQGRIRLARRKKPDPWYIKGLEVNNFFVSFDLISSLFIGSSSLSRCRIALCNILSF